MRLGLGLGLSRRRRRRPVYDVDALAAFAAMTAQPIDADKQRYSDLIAGLKTLGIWASLDWLCVFAAHDPQAAKLNLRNPAKSMTSVNLPTFTPYRGYTGDGSTSYLDFGEPFAFSGANFTQNNGAITAYCNQAGAATGLKPHISSGASSGNGRSAILVRNSAGTNTFALNATASTSYAGEATALGFRSALRQHLSSVRMRRNGVQVGSESDVSATPHTGSSAKMLRRTTDYSDDRMALGSFGAGRTDEQDTGFYNLALAFLTPIGGH